MSDPTGFSVPKFSSFKPKAPAQETEEKPKEEKEARPEKSRERRREHRHRSRSRSRERRRNRHGDEKRSSDSHDSGRSREDRPQSERHGDSRRHHRSRSRSPSGKEVARRRSRSRTPIAKESGSRRKSASKSPSIPLIASGSKYFIIDRKGDPQNITYGRIHRYDIPRFRRAGWGNIFGLHRRFKIERGHSEEAEGMIIVDSRQLVGKKEKYAFARNEKKGARLLKIKEVQDDGSEDLLASNGDFIPLSKPMKKERRDSSPSAEGDYERRHFQLIEEKAEDKPEDSDLVYATETDSDAEGRIIKIEEATRQKHVELSREAEKHPKDIEAWFALINHQDAMLGLGDAQHKATEAEIKSTADIKISMYQKALKAAGRKSDPLKNRERIILEMMKEGAKVWTQAEQAERWEQATRQEVASSVLWKRYLDFRMSDFQGFVYEDLKQLFLDRIGLLTNVKDNIQLDDPSLRLEKIHQQMVYVLIRATLFMRENGRTELSVAIWQAVLEYNCYHRQEAGRGELEDFWESEVARIGEKGAKGFSSLDDEDPPEARKDKDLPSKFRNVQDVLAGWAGAERFRAGSSRWPAKTCDDTVEDDPYRVILWSDIEEFIVDLGVAKDGQWKLSNDAHMMLVDGFLMFCRLPPLMRAGWYYDQFSLDNLIDVSSEHIRKEYLVRTSESEEGLDPFNASRSPQKDKSDDEAHGYIFASSIHNFVMSTDTLFPSKSWAQSLPKWTDLYTDDPFAGPLDFRFVQRCLDALLRSYPTDGLAEYYLAWMLINQPFNMTKLTSDIIFKRPHSRRLYNAHALILWNQGKKEKAASVWTKVLGMAESPTRTEKRNDISLWRSRILCHLADGDKEIALKCLLSIGGDAAAVNDVDTKSSVLHLRAKQQLSSTRDFLLSSGSPVLAAVAAQNAECLSLLYYLAPSADSTDDRDIEGALGVIDHFVAALKSYNKHLSKEHESILQASARLLWYHIRSGPFRPALVRERMAEALKLFPQNTIFMSLYAWNESRARIDERVRAMLRDTVLLPQHDCITSRLFAIRHEMLRGNKHSIRAAFEHALESEGGKDSAGLWRLYILWCAQSQDDKIKEQAKLVLHRGMRACPGVKQIMMEAFETLRPLMDDEECKNVYTVMEENEVRVHVNLEDWVEEQSYGESDSTEIRV